MKIEKFDNKRIYQCNAQISLCDIEGNTVMIYSYIWDGIYSVNAVKQQVRYELSKMAERESFIISNKLKVEIAQWFADAMRNSRN